MPKEQNRILYHNLFYSEGLVMSRSISFNLQLFIEELKCPPMNKFEDFYNTSNYIMQIKWRGSRSTSFGLKGFKRNHTMKQKIQRSGTLSWNEGFDHACKLKKLKADSYKSWIINLEIQEIDPNSRGRLTRIGRAKVDVAEFAELGNEKSINLPIICNIKGRAVEVELMIKLRFAELQARSNVEFTLPRALSLRSFSCTRPQTYGNKVQYPRTALARNLTNDLSHFLVRQFSSKLDDTKQNQQPSFIRILSRSKSTIGSKAYTNCKDPLILNKESEDGGDDVDNDCRHQSNIRLIKQTKVLPEESFHFPTLGFEDENRFEVGKWEKKKFISRDGEMELISDVFFASIDQRSDKAAGGGACTVLSTIIAHWLHENLKILPLRCQFDELVRDGSSEWRKLCENKNHREKFSDHHFDLETVLEAKVRPLEVMTDKSYIGFFSSEFLQDVMLFDSIWSEIISIGMTEEERVYITSWNDHFFVLKVEREAIYMIDTLGERLFEGCNQAYILRFDKESAIYRNIKGSDECEEIGRDMEAFCTGMDSCKEYIKGFLAAVPLRELKQDMERGLVEEAQIHRRLQIEFHYTIPSSG